MFVVCHWNDINDKGQRNIANTSLWRHLGLEILFCSLIENKMILKTYMNSSKVDGCFLVSNQTRWRGDHLKAVNFVCCCDLGSVNPRDVSALGEGVQAWELISRLRCMKNLEDSPLQMSFFETRLSSWIQMHLKSISSTYSFSGNKWIAGHRSLNNVTGCNELFC